MTAKTKYADIAARKAAGWDRVFKGSPEKGGAWIWRHPATTEGRAVVENAYGFIFAGERYPTFGEAAAAALQTGATTPSG